uniref:Uncharacterized protein n=1 Tax=Ciona savignyi TaxID=51511 RepID=H2Z0V7_CIOSA
MSIFAALFATTMFALETIGAINAQYAANWYRYNGYYCTPYYKESYYQSSTYVPTCNSPTRPSEYIESVYIPSTYVSCNYYNDYSNGGVGMSTLHGFMAFYAFVELIVAIVHSVYCCKYKCGPQSSSATRPVVQYVYQHPITQQMPGSNVSHPGGIPMAGAYTTAGTVPYQIQPVPHMYTNQDNMMINQHNTGNPVMTSPNPMTSHDATSSGNTSLPKYSEIPQTQQ